MKYLPGLMIGIFFFIVCIATLSDYGMNEDSPGHFARGQTYLNKLITGRDTFNIPQLRSPFLFTPGQRISMYKFNVYETQLAPMRPVINQEGYYTRQKQHQEFEKSFGRNSFYKHNSWSMNYWLNNDGGHPPVSDILEALSNKIFYERLGITGDIEGYYIYVILTACLAILSVYIFVFEVWGFDAALFSVVSLAMYPLFFAESHFNIKDISELSYFTTSIIAFYFWVAGRKKRWAAAFFIAFFLGVGTKLNILFVPVILLIWLFIFRKSPFVKHWFSKRLFFIFGFIFFVELIAFIIVWPYLWNTPFQSILEILAFYKITSGTNLELQQASPYLVGFLGMDVKGILYVVTTVPFFTLVFFLSGIWSYIRCKKDCHKEAFVLVLLWFLIPIIRVLRPGGDIFDSIRQYMEYLPAMMIMAGVGGVYLVQMIAQKYLLPLGRVRGAVFGIYIGYLAAILIMFHPNQNVFFNILAGSTSGAVDKKLYGWQSSYDNPYRQAAQWLNTNAEKNARLAFLDGTMLGLSPVFLRNDIYFGTYFSGLHQKGEYIASIVYTQPPTVFPYLYLERFLNPVYEVKAGGFTIAKVWKNDLAHLKKSIQTKKIEKITAPIFGEDIKGKYWEVSLDIPENIVSIHMKSPIDSCLRLSGLWKLDTFVLPWKESIDDTTTDIYFPSSKTDKIRYYSVSSENCYAKARIESITVLK